MERSKAHEPEKLTRYAFGDLKGKEKESLERHLQSCLGCREYLSFIQDFNEGLREAKPQEPLPGEPCPDPALLAALQEGDLDKETAEHLRVHMLYCENCREDYQILERLQPKAMEVVLRLAGSVIEVLRPPDTLTWESPLVTAPVRGEMVWSAPFRMSQLLSDDEKNKSRVTVQVERAVEAEHVSVLAEGESVRPEWKWRLSLLDGNGDEWVGMPFDKAKVLVTSGVPLGLYSLQVRKSDQVLVPAFKFTVENMRSEEALEKAREYMESGDYFRALAILLDAVRRDPTNKQLLNELDRAKELAKEEERQEDESENDGKETG